MLRGSIRLFRVRGIQLSVHFTFILLLAYIAWEGWKEGGGLISAILSVVTVLIFFSCVVLHEFGHAFTAQSFGVTVPRILLLPIGGMAEFTTLPRQPSHEILIALAGPAVNFTLVLILSIFSPFPDWHQLRTLELSDLQLLLVMNLTMGCFNLLPAFPMDGGRIVRAILAQHLPYLKATRWAVGLGKLLASLGIVAMLVLPEHPHKMGAVLFVFIIVAGELEYRALARQEAADRQGHDYLTPYVQRPEPPPLN